MPLLSSSLYNTWYEDDCFCDPWTEPETVLIQHGFGRNAQFWHHWVPKLAGQYRVIRRDLRGHGQSGDGGDAPWPFDGLVEDLSQFIATLELGKVHLIGESTGGMLSTGLAHRHPEQLRSLTLCSSPTTISPAGQRYFAAGHKDWRTALTTMGSEGWARWLLGQPGTASMVGPDQSEWWVQQFSQAPATALANYSDVISNTDTASLLPELTVPALVLAPTRSAATTLPDQLSIASAIPGAQIMSIDGSGHEIYVDKAEDTVRAFLSFTNGLVPR